MIDINIQEKKLSIIEGLINIDDNAILNEIEDILNTYKKIEFNTFSKQELIERANESELDIINGRVYSTEDVDAISKSW